MAEAKKQVFFACGMCAVRSRRSLQDAAWVPSMLLVRLLRRRVTLAASFLQKLLLLLSR